MKPIFIITIFLSSFFSLNAQEQTYQDGELLEFRVHYGWFNASHATLKVTAEELNGQPVYHIKGHGESIGLLDLFFEVNDTYESYISKATMLPLKFIRNIDEGGYTKHKVIYYNQEEQQAKVHNLKDQTVKTFNTKSRVQDMISIVYHLRNNISTQLNKKGDSFVVNMFFDENNYKFKTVYLGHEIIDSEFGKIECIKLRPYVQAGRVFKEQESLTIWVSADRNKVPIKIRAKLAVGSLTADLEGYENLKYPLKTLEK